MALSEYSKQIQQKKVSKFRKWGERIASAIFLIGLSPLLLITAAAIRLDSKGPALFRQVRIGLDEEAFVMLKFRTMHVGAHEKHQELIERQMAVGGSYLLHQPQDPRTTRLGGVLRKFSIDELPQFVNVLRGEMSLVGPRPMMPEEVEHLTLEQRRRFKVPPGVTGWAQVNGRGFLGADQYVSHDLHYLDSFSPWLYWKILFKTPLTIAKADGAA